jgi:hypothetical protein
MRKKRSAVSKKELKRVTPNEINYSTILLNDTKEQLKNEKDLLNKTNKQLQKERESFLKKERKQTSISYLYQSNRRIYE